jgi:hypothetical protein
MNEEIFLCSMRPEEGRTTSDLETKTKTEKPKQTTTNQGK